MNRAGVKEQSKVDGLPLTCLDFGQKAVGYVCGHFVSALSKSGK